MARRRRRKSVTLTPGAILLALLVTAAAFIWPWASGHMERWALVIFGAWFLLIRMPYKVIRWSLRRGGKLGASTGVRSRKRLRFWIFRLNLAGRFLPLPSSVGIDAGPYSINSRTKRSRVDLPGPWWWQSQKQAAATTYREQMEARPGCVPRTPTKKWEPAGHAQSHDGQMERDEHGPFPVDRTEHCGYEILRIPRPGKRRSYFYIVENVAQYTSLREALEAAEGLSDQQLLFNDIKRVEAQAGQRPIPVNEETW
jgi:hypothetical protein